ncbi:MAG: hypothetical protein QOJ12_2479, partial [Thermoleophilales bacterium]|nr:hypothetical protein [Thermoleophilales bacterium]
MGKPLFALSALALLLPAAPASAAETVRDMAGDAVATCVRDAGQGGLLSLQAPVTQTSSPTDLLTATPEKIERTAGADLGVLDACPEVASGGDVTVVAGFARGRLDPPGRFVETVKIRAAVRVGDGDFAAPVTLDEIATPAADEIAVAVGAGGDVVVAWREFRSPPAGLPTAVRIMAARRPAGAGSEWTAPEEVVPWTKLDDSLERYGGSGQTHVAAGVDGAGRTTVAWVVGIAPLQRRGIGDLSDVGVATAARGGAFDSVRLARRLQGVGQPQLAVAPDGRALLALPTLSEVGLWERQPGADVFAAAPSPGATETGSPVEAAVALDPSGAAVIVWRFADNDGGRVGIKAVRRGPGEQFGRPAVVWSRSGAGSLGVSFGWYATAFGAPEPPLDGARLRVAISRTGHVAMTWAEERRVFDDRLPSLFVATGALTGALTVTRVGSPCRAINGAAPFAPPGGDAAAAWTDNASDGSFELPSGTGRLHVSGGGAEAPPPAIAPRARIAPLRGTQRLWSADALEVNVTCDSPCDARVFLPGGGEPGIPGPLAAASTTFASAGTKTVRLEPSYQALAGFKPRDTAVLVHACSLDGTTRTRNKQRVRLVRPKPPPVPRPVDVRARRSGRDVVVTWRTEFAARRTQFGVMGTEKRKLTKPL